MSRQRRRLAFLSFAAPGLATPLVDALVRLGYHVAAPEPALPAVVLLGPRAGRWPQDAAGRALGVVPRGGEAWDGEALSRCCDFVVWPCDERELRARLERFVGGAPRPAADGMPLGHLGLIGRSPPFLEVLRRIERLGRGSAPVLILGATGTGKEMVARAVHYLGARRPRPFIPVNCGALPDSLLESELFGHVRGAFTDAKEAQPGLVAEAEGGTLFLDEVETLSPRGQVALLRFLQDQRYRPLGGRELRQADVRIIAASNADLEAMVAAGRFREDLLFRLTILTLLLPRLCERGEDVLLLAEHFLGQFSARYGVARKRLSGDAQTWMRRHDWPGNVRELENFIHRGVVLAEDEVVDVASALAPSLARRPTTPAAGASPAFREAKAAAVAAFERDYLVRLIRAARGNVSLAARRAGKERRALGRLLKKHGIDPGDFATA